VINPHTLVTGVLMGTVLILVGFIPGLFSNLIEGVRRASEQFTSRQPGAMPFGSEGHQQPAWLAVVGTGLILTSILAYVTR